MINKYKAWDIRNNKFVTSGIQFNNTEMRIDVIPNVILLQYIGLKDDNGNDVCESDIIRWEAEHFTLKYGWYGDSETKTNEFGYYLSNGIYNFKYVGGGEIVGNTFEGIK